MEKSKKYWNSVEHLDEDSSFMEAAQNEFAESIPVDEFIGRQDENSASTSRRDFLKFLGFSLTAATLAACEAPVTKSIPYVVKPEEITPGVPNYYASTYSDGYDYCSILVKTREGRPIHIEGNKLSKITKGRVNARVNSSVLSLYDSKRYTGPKTADGAAGWEDVDSSIKTQLSSIAASGGNVRLLTGTINSPSTKAAIKEFGKKFSTEEGSANFKHVQYDSISYHGMLEANKRDFGKRMIPDYDFSKAEMIVGVDADFLSNWLLTSAYLNDYSLNRKPDKNKKMSKHYQFESGLTLTGSNADVRGAVKPSQLGYVVTELYNALAAKAGKDKVPSGEIEDDNNIAKKISNAADDLWSKKGKSLVVCGVNDVDVQSVVNAINMMLGNYGTTINTDVPLKIRQGNDQEVADLVNELSAGSVDALLVYGVDPAYSLPASMGFKEAMKRAQITVSLDHYPSETSENCDFVCPDHHFLEAWNDANPKGNSYSLQQPCINPLFNTRPAQASLLNWAGLEDDYYKFIKKFWKENLQPLQNKLTFFDAFWNESVHDGVFDAPAKAKMKEEGEEAEGTEKSGFTDNARFAASKLAGRTNSSELEAFFYPTNSLGDGRNASNPWLQELPDPVTKVVWDNYITMNPADMKGTYEIKTAQETPADMASIKVRDMTVELPVVSVPGQKRGTVGVAVGYGKTKVDGEMIGKNVFPMLEMTGQGLSYRSTGVSVEKSGNKYPIASTQTHHTMMGRKIVNETSIETYQKQSKQVWNEDVKLTDVFGKKKSTDKLDLWQDHPIDQGHRWGLSIDLNSCTGCNACVTACHSENNVPVVGRDEARRTRTMSWIRIDRYYSSDADPEKHDGEKNYDAMEDPSTYPDVVFQPVMCQHCNHAPCETVCPVAATTHSNEGLNQMAYNRCIGTRYCANNCPFKVRRFNWFNYNNDEKFTDFNPAQDDLMRMVLNPDVVVRSRGVMEKCSMCVQRIQSGKLEAKKKGEPVEDGQIQTACAAACNDNAIQFGDLNDSRHTIFEMKKDDRAYNMLEEIGVKPNVYYQTKVRNVPAPEYEKTSQEPEDHSA